MSAYRTQIGGAEVKKNAATERLSKTFLRVAERDVVVSVHARGGFSGGSAASGCGVVEVAIGSVG
jgi:hypothetical protein